MGLSGGELDRSFGRLLRAQRESRGMTQENLASQAGLSRTSVVNIERGRQGVSLGTLYRLAEALHCLPSRLLPAPGVAPTVEVRIGSASDEEQELLAALRRRAELT